MPTISRCPASFLRSLVYDTPCHVAVFLLLIGLLPASLLAVPTTKQPAVKPSTAKPAAAKPPKKPAAEMEPKVPEPFPGPMLKRFLDGPMKGVEEIIFAVRVPGRDHWYVTFGNYADRSEYPQRLHYVVAVGV